MTLRELVYSIWEELDSHAITDDTKYEYEYLRAQIISVNKTLVKDALISEKQPPDGYYQIVECIEIDCHKGSCTIAGVVFEDDDIYYSAELPPLMKSIGWRNIQFLGVFGFVKKIDRVSLDEFIYAEDKDPMFTTIGDVAIFRNLPLLSQRLVGSLLLEDPTDACDWTDDNDFPCPSDLKLKMLVKKDILWPSMQPDLIHDAQRTITPPQRQQQSDD